MKGFLLMGSALAGVLFYGLIAPPDKPRVIDGDTLAFGDRHVRLWGIDAPELAQVCQFEDGSDYPCGNAARVHLQALVDGRAVTCELQAHDKYGREVSRCTVAGADLAAGMVQEGWALDWPRYSSGYYDSAQSFAKDNRLGMWRGSFELPWEWRWSDQRKP